METTNHDTIWTSDLTECGKIISKHKEYCAGCMRVTEKYYVRWSDGKLTKPCSRSCSVLTDGRLKID